MSSSSFLPCFVSFFRRSTWADGVAFLATGTPPDQVASPYLEPEDDAPAAQHAAEADGRTGQRNRSAVMVRVPRGGSPMVSSMSAAA